jgi:hypothetical protein
LLFQILNLHRCDEEGKVVYTWVGLDDKGASHPGLLPDTTVGLCTLNQVDP